MSLLLDACLNYAFSPQQVAVGLAGLIKLGDIVSDIFFILDLKEWHNLFGRSWLFDGEEKVNYKRYLIAAAFFTAVGIAYDLCMCYVVLKDRQKKNTFTERIKSGFRSFAGVFFDAEDGRDEKWVWWRHFNLVIEEIPQLIILLCFFGNYHRGCEVWCSDEQKKYMTSLYISAVVSTVFTCLTIGRVSVGMYRAWRREKERKKQGILSVLPTVAFESNDQEKSKKEKIEKKMRQLKDSIRPPSHDGSDGVHSETDSGRTEATANSRTSKTPGSGSARTSKPGVAAAAQVIKSMTPKAVEKGKIEKKMRQLKDSIRPPAAGHNGSNSLPTKTDSRKGKTSNPKISETPGSGSARTSRKSVAAAAQMIKSIAPKKAAASDSSCDTTEPDDMPTTIPTWKCVVVSELTDSLFFCRQER